MLITIQKFGRAVCACLLPALLGVNAQAQETPADEVVTYPEPRDPDFFRSSRDGWFWLNDPTVSRRKKTPETHPPTSPEASLAKPRNTKTPE